MTLQFLLLDVSQKHSVIVHKLSADHHLTSQRESAGQSILDWSWFFGKPLDY